MCCSWYRTETHDCIAASSQSGGLLLLMLDSGTSRTLQHCKVALSELICRVLVLYFMRNMLCFRLSLVVR
jgi:hypothetical protein